MKPGRDIVELAKEIERRRQSARDFVADTRHMRMSTFHPAGTEEAVIAPQLQIGEALSLPVLPHAHGQIAQHVGVPKPYYDKMLREAPELLARNVNHWFHNTPAKRMVRTLDDATRAFLSDSYRPLDNHRLFEAVLPPLLQRDLEVVSCEVTERRLYLKVVDKRINRDIPSGRHMGDGTHTIFDTASPAMVVSNSEIGDGALSVSTGIWTKACTNLAVFAERSKRTRHVGSKIDIGDELYAMLSDDTRRKTDDATFAQITDVVAHAFDEVAFEALVAKVGEAAKDQIDADPVAVLEVTAKHFGLNEGERGGILQHLIRGGDLTRYGLHAAITRTAEDLADYDRASQLEVIGGNVIELDRTQWRTLATEWRDKVPVAA